ncbi:MAG TPA: glycosyltransferase [Xenococcaceae cyanobacterium]
MRKLYFLLPGTTGKFGGGGLWAELKTVNLVRCLSEAEIITYRQKESNYLFLADILPPKNPDQIIFVVSWGFDVPKLISKLRDYNVIYHAHSAGYNFRLPSDIPIITVSRNTMGYWGQKSPNSLIYYLPNEIGTEFYNQNLPRDIDILVQQRKSSQYLLKQLVPRLKTCCRVQLIDSYIEDLAALFNRSKVYLYDSAEYWGISGVTEGFGLPPLEALACGCQVFSSVNHGLADYLDPGFNCQKIASYSVEYDVQKIIAAVKNSNYNSLSDSFFQQYRKESLLSRLQIILSEINRFFDFKQQQQTKIANLNIWQIQQLRLTKNLIKIKRKFFNN